MSILAAQIPAQPSPPTTTVSSLNVVVAWDLPNNGGSVITAYEIKILQRDGLTYSTILADCNGTLPSVVSFRTCSIPITSLMASPFNLPWGATVTATVSAYNVYGWSTVSLPTITGAIILTIPDAPLTLVNNLAVTFGTTIGLTWTSGVSDGGTPVIDYTLWSD